MNVDMSKTASPIDAIERALPAVQVALRLDISARIEAGEAIGRIENGKVIASRSPSRDLDAKRRELIAQHTAKKQSLTQRKSIA